MDKTRLRAAFDDDERTATSSSDVVRALDAALLPILESGAHGRFATGGRTPSFMPTLDIEGLGVLSLPLVPEQARRLITLAERAPYGRGDKTLVDTAVRSAWQLSPDRFTFGDPLWARRSLPRIVDKVKAGLGVTAEVEAQLYKLLVYEEGSFFLEHRDTEKAPGMFGTLVIALPSAYEGGELMVRHGDDRMTFDLRSSSLSRVRFAAFYTDCLHALAPVTQGYRACLVYNLVSRARLRAPKLVADRGPVVSTLRALAAAASPIKIVRVLSHHYTLAGLSFVALKGADAAVAQALTAAAAEARCRVHLGMVSIHESGAAEPVEYRSRDRRRRRFEGDEERYEIIDVSERHAWVTDLVSPSGGGGLDHLPIEADEVSPLGLLDTEPFDEEHFSEATGNEGGSFERTYRRAALVLWPAARDYAVLAQLALPDLVDALIAPVLGQDPDALAQLEPLVARLRDAGHGLSGHTRSTVMGLLIRAARLDLLERFIEDTYLAPEPPPLEPTTRSALMRTRARPSSPYGEGDDEGLVAAFGALPEARAVVWVERFMRAHLASRGHLRVIRLLAAITAKPGAIAAAAAKGACAALPELAASQGWERPTPAFVATLVSALDHVDAAHRTTHALGAVDLILAHRTMFDLDAHLFGAVEDAALGQGAGAERLRAAVRAALRQRTRVRPTPPADRAREAAWGCPCADCKLAKQFLADPARAVWELKAVEHRRRHLESQVGGSDVRCETLRNGSPLTLRLTKTNVSFERRLALYESDLKRLAGLGS